jgi:hypothetical protein
MNLQRVIDELVVETNQYIHPVDLAKEYDRYIYFRDMISQVRASQPMPAYHGTPNKCNWDDNEPTHIFEDNCHVIYMCRDCLPHFIHRYYVTVLPLQQDKDIINAVVSASGITITKPRLRRL